MAVDQHLSQRVALRASAGVAAARVGTLVLAEILVAFASASEVQAYAGVDMTAGDVFYNISRGMMVQGFPIAGRVFTLPVLWLTNMLVLIVGALVFAVPSRDGIEWTRMMASGNRARYWRTRCLLAAIWPIFALIIRLACSEAFALVWGGSTVMGRLSNAACILFESQGVAVWDGTLLVVAVLIEAITGCILCFTIGTTVLTTNVPIACVASVGYAVIGAYSSSPFFLSNWVMAYRAVDYAGDIGTVFGAVAGACALVACCACFHVRLQQRDII